MGREIPKTYWIFFSFFFFCFPFFSGRLLGRDRKKEEKKKKKPEEAHVYKTQMNSPH